MINILLKQGTLQNQREERQGAHKKSGWGMNPKWLKTVWRHMQTLSKWEKWGKRKFAKFKSEWFQVWSEQEVGNRESQALLVGV